MENPVTYVGPYRGPWTGYLEMSALERRALLSRTIDAHFPEGYDSTATAKKRTILARSFKDDAAVLAEFHARIFGDDAWRYSVWDDRGNPRYATEVKALIRFPSTLGGDVETARTIEWTRDMLTRFLAASSPVAGGGFHWHVEQMLAVTKKLFKSGVPLDYVNGFHPSGMRKGYPVKEVIEGYQAGLPIEYVAALLEEN